MLYGFLEELEDRSTSAAFFTENLAESTLESGLDLGAMDFIQDEQDQALPRDLLPDRLNPEELQRSNF